jgi:hypothetical protein
VLLMRTSPEVLIEEILALPVEDLERLVAYDRPVVFRAGSAPGSCPNLWAPGGGSAASSGRSRPGSA